MRHLPLIGLILIFLIVFSGCDSDESNGGSAGYTQISGNLSGRLSLSGSPYSVVADVVVPQDVTLTIEPGVEIRFDGFHTLTVDGVLYAVGTMANLISFNSTPANNTSRRGDWEGIIFTNPTQSSILEYCRIEDGALYVDGDEYIKGAVTCKNSSPVIRKCLLINNGYSAVYADSFSTPLVDACTITGNAFSGVVCDTASSPLIRNSVIVSNDDYGVFALLDMHSAPRIEFCDIWDNFTTDVFGIDYDTTIFPGNFSLDPKFADANAGNYQLLSHSPCIDAGDPVGPMDPDQTFLDLGVFFYDQADPSEIRSALNLKYDRITPEHSPYLVTSDIWIEAGDTLIIEPGVVFQFNASTDLRFNFDVLGVLIAEGTSANPIVFTSNREQGLRGDWENFHFYDTALGSKLTHCEVSFSTQITVETNIEFDHCYFYRNELNLCLDNADNTTTFDYCVFDGHGENGLVCGNRSHPVITHCVFNRNNGYGLLCDFYSHPVVENNLFLNNGINGLKCSNYSAPDFINNTLAGNGYYGIYCTSSSHPRLVNNISAYNDYAGIKLLGSSYPDTLIHNCAYSNPDQNFPLSLFYLDPATGDTLYVGAMDSLNYNGDPCDAFNNISLNPVFPGGGVYTLGAGSHCIDAGVNLDDNSVTDIGAFGGPGGNWNPPALKEESPQVASGR